MPRSPIGTYHYYENDELSPFQLLIHYLCYIPKRVLHSSTPRRLLFGSNTIIILLSLGVTVFSIFMMYLLYDPDRTERYIDWGALGIVGLCFTIVCILGIRGANMVSLNLLLTYFWFVTIFLAPLFFGTVGAMDFYGYVETWFKHSWDQPNFEKLRDLFCQDGEELGKCGAPYKGGADFTTLAAWCQDKFNATDCAELRLMALNKAIEWGRGIALVHAGICVFDLIVVCFSMYICYDLITAPILTQSMNDVINYLLVLPIGGCAFLTNYLWWLTDIPSLKYSWLPTLFLAVTVTQVIVLPLGVFAGRVKSRPLLVTYIVMIVLIIGMVCVAGFFCFTLASIIPTDYQPTVDEIGNTACTKKLNGCCCCEVTTNNPVPSCPEWSSDEIIDIVVRDVKLVGSGSFICCIYLVGALVVSSISFISLKNYKSDYV